MISSKTTTDEMQHAEVAGRAPVIAVLLATHNGMRWLPEQVSTILGQHVVNVTLWVSDDASSDGTWEWLQEQSALDPRIKILPRAGSFAKAGSFGSAAQNFYRLVCDAGWSDADYVAFADQDDIWLPEKLSRHASLIEQMGLTAISSNVQAFWPDGRKMLIDKTQPQRKWDYIFEAAAPGCTYVMKPGLVAQLKTLLLDQHSVARQCALHDWLIYAVCRASEGIWYIDPYPSVRYRQHDNNELGAHTGIRQRLRRLQKTCGGWHRQEACKIARSVHQLIKGSEKQADMATLLLVLQSTGLVARLRLLKFALAGRRKFVDRFVLGMLIVSGIW